MNLFEFVVFTTIEHDHEFSIKIPWSVAKIAVIYQKLNDHIVTRHQYTKEIVISIYKIDSYVWWSDNDRWQVSVGIVCQFS